jgi:transcriptional regulator with XRE-family HTH domain
MPRQTLGARIAQARRELAVQVRKDLTQADIAKMVGTTAATMSRWESDVATPKEDALAKLAKALGVTPAYLRYGVVEQSRAPTAAEALANADDGFTVVPRSHRGKKSG